MEFAFRKYQAIGNDYILFDMIDGDTHEFTQERIRKLCGRRFGIGSDGILIITRGNTAPFKMTIINSDGSIAKMCGNGLRCTIKFLVDKGYVAPQNYVDIETDAGLRGGIVHSSDLNSSNVSANIGIPAVSDEKKEFFGKIFSFVDVGNPHCVTFVNNNDDLIQMALNVGPNIETIVEGGINVGFARKLDETTLELAVWERGAGFTEACGTGATSAVVAAFEEGLFDAGNELLVHQRGGDITIKREASGKMIIRGEAVHVYTGQISI